MVMKNKYHVTKTEDGWQGKKEGAVRASVVGNTKKEVLNKTVNIAKNKNYSSVYIHGIDGKIQEERTYPKSKDPFPPKG